MSTQQLEDQNDFCIQTIDECAASFAMLEVMADHLTTLIVKGSDAGRLLCLADEIKRIANDARSDIAATGLSLEV